MSGAVQRDGDHDMAEPVKIVSAGDGGEAAADLPAWLTRAEPEARMPRAHMLRVVEALLFAAAEPVAEADLTRVLPAGADVAGLLAELAAAYRERGVNVVQVAGRWTLRTAEDLSFLLRREAVEQKRLSRAALEILAIVAYHQPVTRAEIEDIRGVATARGSLDMLMEVGWVRMRGRRRSPGRPVTYATTEAFLEHFGLNALSDLPGVAELKGAGLLDANLPPDFLVPAPRDDDALGPDEDPLDAAAAEAPEMDLAAPDDDPPADEPEALEMDLPEVLDHDPERR